MQATGCTGLAVELWGYATVREVEGRIPTISFGMGGEPFTATGVNRERLWLHYNYLPVWDVPARDKPSMTPYVLLTEVLETCRTLDDLGGLLSSVNRSGGMMIFAVEGVNNRGAIFECACKSHVRRDLSESWLAGTNHYLLGEIPVQAGAYAPLSVSRYGRLVALLGEQLLPRAACETPGGLVRILADPGIEDRGEDYGAVYACVACPGDKAVWFTLGGYPVPSAGAWQQIEWP